MAFGEETANSFPMVGGNGPNSYSQNSSYQRALIRAVKEKINEAICATLDLENPHFELTSNALKIADFGCSDGPNTFVAVENIIEALQLKYQEKNMEFQVFFNDQSSNDFNTLFRTLPSTRNYFTTGVPGSFFGRVLPKGSLHVGHCSYSLQWLSQVPADVLDEKSPAWNKGSIHCSGLAKEVTEAYLSQFKSDMRKFLSARAEELVSGGLMLLLGTCLPDGVLMSETMKGMILDSAGASLYDMAKLGLVNKEKVDSFNMPIYVAHVSEFKQVIEENGCFTIERLERVHHANEEFPLDVEFLVSSYRAAFGGVAEEHFGTEVAQKMMGFFAGRLAPRLLEFAKAKKDMQFFILLRRS